MNFMEVKGVQSSTDAVNGLRLKVDGDKWLVTAGQKLTMNATFQVDQTKEPRAIDFVQLIGRHETSSTGIYKLDGDTLTVCRSAGYKDRPKEFKTARDAFILVVWKRATQ